MVILRYIWFRVRFQILKNKCIFQNWVSVYGRFAVEREETLKKIKNELILNLDKFQHLKYFWYININLIFFRVCFLSTAKCLYMGWMLRKFVFEITNVLDQMIKSTSILLKNFFLKKNSIWSLFPALTSYIDKNRLIGKYPILSVKLYRCATYYDKYR